MSLHDRLSKIVGRIQPRPREFRVQALLHYAGKVPPLPEESSADRP